MGSNHADGDVLKKNAVKKGGYFAVWDLAVYVLLAAAIVGLFLGVWLGGRNKAAGIEISADGETVYTYVFGKGGAVAKGKEALVSETVEGDCVVVTVRAQGGGYNEIVIEPNGKKAYVRNADCSYKSDCAHMPAITAENGVIVCVPHALVMRALGAKDDLKPSVGG